MRILGIFLSFLFSAELAYGFGMFPSFKDNSSPYGSRGSFSADNSSRSYAYSNAGFKSGCRKVKVDCTQHIIDIDGHRSRIDCGKGGTTRSGSGTVGYRHTGRKVPDGLKINTPGMSGTTKVFHTWHGYRRDGRNNSYPPGTMPTGQDKSRGCVIVNDQVYAKLKSSCKGKPLTIIGNDRHGRMIASARRSRSAY